MKDLSSTTFMHYVYILQSKLNGQQYTGSTNNLKKRFQEHNDGNIISTKRYKPWKLLYYEAYIAEDLARVRERRLKYNGNAMKELKKRVGFFNPRAAFKPLKSGAGFTLVELLLYMGILSVFLSILTAIFVTALDVQMESEAATSVERDGTYILAKLAYDVHRASSISIPLSLGSNATNLKILVGAVDYTYSLDGSENLTLVNDIGTNNLNSYDSKVSGLSVTRLGNTGGVEDTLKINFTITSRTQRVSFGYETKAFETNLALRRQ